MEPRWDGDKNWVVGRLDGQEWNNNATGSYLYAFATGKLPQEWPSNPAWGSSYKAWCRRLGKRKVRLSIEARDLRSGAWLPWPI